MSRVFTVDELNAVIGNYRQQQAAATEQLRQIDETRFHTLKTLDLLQGAIVALETLRDSAPPVVETPADAPAPELTDIPEGEGC